MTSKTLFDSTNDFIVRIVFTSLILDPSILEQIELNLVPSLPGTPFGLNHVALQVGPFLIHYHDGEVVTVHAIHSKACCAMIYPDPGFKLSRTVTEEERKQGKRDLMDLAKVMVDFNLRAAYNRLNNSCQTFVMQALERIGCEMRWTKDGPVSRFVDNIVRGGVREGKGEIGMGLVFNVEDWNSLERKVEKYEDLMRLWDDLEMAGDIPYAEEHRQVLKCVQRAYVLRNMKDIEMNADHPVHRDPRFPSIHGSASTSITVTGAM